MAHDNKHLLSHIVSQVRNLGAVLVGGSGSESVMRFQSRGCLGLQSPESFTGRFVPTLIHSHTRQVRAGCGQEASGPPAM